jgi:uncharacterized protein YukE
MEKIWIPVSAGELLDKISILEIKSERMADPDQLANVRAELAMLLEAWRNSVDEDAALQALHQQLREVNRKLWDIEDAIRARERADDFGPDFIALARSVYLTNDQRSRIKRELNRVLGSPLVEEKSYRPY